MWFIRTATATSTTHATVVRRSHKRTVATTVATWKRPCTRASVVDASRNVRRVARARSCRSRYATSRVRWITRVLPTYSRSRVAPINSTWPNTTSTATCITRVFSASIKCTRASLLVRSIAPAISITRMATARHPMMLNAVLANQSILMRSFSLQVNQKFAFFVVVAFILIHFLLFFACFYF